MLYPSLEKVMVKDSSNSWTFHFQETVRAKKFVIKSEGLNVDFKVFIYLESASKLRKSPLEKLQEYSDSLREPKEDCIHCGDKVVSYLAGKAV